uniref:Uncharacterized protein n=1 Tax=Anopheles stephensi TaxID=30069 RepID=A0A182YLL3_ANOST
MEASWKRDEAVVMGRKPDLVDTSRAWASLAKTITDGRKNMRSFTLIGEASPARVGISFF